MSGASRGRMHASPLGVMVVLALGVGGVAATQPKLAKVAHEVKEGDDPLAFPPPAELRVAVLGWDAAAVDVLWAALLVDYGTHWGEHRPFNQIPRYVDAIIALEPTYRPLYRYVDTLLAYRPLQGTEADARMARGYLERGLRERPDDASLWTKYGQFLAFVGPSFLHDNADREAWRRDGAVAMGHAVEFGADPDRALSAASILGRSGEKEQAIHYLERAYAFTEHPSMAAVHEAIGRRLGELEASSMRDTADAIVRAVDARWQRDLPFLTRGKYLLVGPIVDVARCAGPDTTRDADCARDFTGVAAAAGAKPHLGLESSEDPP